jgi:hypothetical protein
MLHVRKFVAEDGHRHHPGTIRPAAACPAADFGPVGPASVTVRPDFGQAARATIALVAAVALTAVIYAQVQIPPEVAALVGP